MSVVEGVETIDTVRKEYLENSLIRTGFEAFFTIADGLPVGYASFFLNPPHKLSSENVVWPSVAIGEPRYRRRGLVREIGLEVARRAHRYGATHCEAGVFDSNHAIISLLLKYGFSPVGKIDIGPKRIPSTHFIRCLEAGDLPPHPRSDQIQHWSTRGVNSDT